MVRIKICCIGSEAEAEAALAAGASAIGLVAAMPTGPGPISDDLIARIAARMRGRILTVLLTAEKAPDSVSAHVARCGPAAVQLVDRVPEATVARLRADHPGVQVIRVVHVTGASVLEEARRAAASADMLLLDSGAPGARELGGTGRVHDWEVSARIVAESPVPVWLAGGLNPGNAAGAIARVRPHGLDVCSGLRRDGALDPDLLAAFMKVATGA
jgi:phosphoribosylanthranilate isomerase